jgi:hypothetical protein
MKFNESKWPHHFNKFPVQLNKEIKSIATEITGAGNNADDLGLMQKLC